MSIAQTKMLLRNIASRHLGNSSKIELTQEKKQKELKKNKQPKCCCHFVTNKD